MVDSIDSSGLMPRPPTDFNIKQRHDKCIHPIYSHHLDDNTRFTNRKLLEGIKSTNSYQFNLNRSNSDAFVTYKLVLRSVVAKIYVSLAKFAVFFHRKELNRIEQLYVGHVMF